MFRQNVDIASTISRMKNASDCYVIDYETISPYVTAVWLSLLVVLCILMTGLVFLSVLAHRTLRTLRHISRDVGLVSSPIIDSEDRSDARPPQSPSKKANGKSNGKAKMPPDDLQDAEI